MITHCGDCKYYVKIEQWFGYCTKMPYKELRNGYEQDAYVTVNADSERECPVFEASGKSNG